MRPITRPLPSSAPPSSPRPSAHADRKQTIGRAANGLPAHSLHVLPHLGHHEKYPFTAVRARGASLKATEQPIDTSTAAGKCFLDMLGVFAEFETSLRRERQLEGIAKAKAAGVYKGRPASIDVARCAR
jgi:Resolvase, N terminal domain